LKKSPDTSGSDPNYLSVYSVYLALMKSKE